LKLIWALLDLVTIAVLGSGLYLWLARPTGTLPDDLLAVDGADPQPLAVAGED
jgi:hypothetical protein